MGLLANKHGMALSSVLPIISGLLGLIGSVKTAHQCRHGELTELGAAAALQRQPELQDPYAVDLPTIGGPHAICSYTFLDLTQCAEESFDEFCYIADQELLRERFQCFLWNYGPSIFLQKSHMFQFILQHAKLGPVSTAFWCLMTLAQAWQADFRAAMDAAPDTCWESSELGMMDGGSVGNSAFAEHESVVADFSISIPFAAYEAFMSMTPLLSDPRHLVPVLRLLSMLLPFVKLHLSTCQLPATTAVETNSLTRPVAVVIDSLDRLPHNVLDAERVYTRERIVTFAIDVFMALSSLSSHPEILQDQLLGFLLAAKHPNGVPATVADRILTRPASSDGDRLLENFMRHGKEWVQTGVLEEIEETWHMHRERVLCRPIVIRALMECLTDQVTAEFRARAYAFLSTVINDARGNDDFLSQILISSQLLFDFDEGKLMEAVLNSIKNIERCTLATFCLTALLHKDKRLRERAAEKLHATFATELRTAEFHISPAECLVIPPSLIAMLSSPTPSGLRTDHKGFDLELFARALEQDPKDRSSFTDYLRALMSDIQDERTQHRALWLDIASKLVNEFCGNDPWTKSASALPRLLSVVRILMEKDAKVLQQLHAAPSFFLRLAEHVFNPDAQVRYEIGRILGSFLADAAPSSRLSSCYHIYGTRPTPTTESLRMPPDVDWMSFFKEYRQIVRLLKAESLLFGSRPNPFTWRANSAGELLTTARNHAQFHEALDALQSACCCERDATAIIDNAIDKPLSRILTVPPANADDAELLSRVLVFVQHILDWSTDLMHAEQWLIPCFQRVLLPCLHNTMPTSDILQGHVLRFAVKAFRCVPQSLQMEVLSQTECLAAVILWIQNCQTDPSPENMCNALELLAGVVALPAQFPTSTLDNVVYTLVSFVTSVQRMRDAGEPRYHERGLYTRSVLCLRIIANKSTSVNAWLKEDSLGWLVTLLNDEAGVQKLALGIVAKFIAADDYRKAVEAVLPDYLNLALEIFADPAADYSMKKEAVVVIGNFLLAAVDTRSSSENDRIISKLVDGGLFNALPSAFAASTTFTPFHTCLADTLLTVARMEPRYLRQMLSNLDLWEALVRILHPEDSLAGPRDLCQRFAHRQATERPYPLTAWPARVRFLEMLWIMLNQDPELQEYIIQHTPLIGHVLGILDFCASQVKSDSRSSGDVIDEVLEPSMRVLSELLLTCATQDPSSLQSPFQSASTGGNVLRMIVWSQNGDKQMARTACQLLARLVTLHYGGTVDLSMDSLFETRLSEDEAAGTIAVTLYDVLAHVLLNKYDADDAPSMESVRLSLQALLGCNGLVKQRALQGGFLPSILKRSQGILRSPVLNQRQQHDLLLHLTMWRHSMAGSQMVKIQAGKAKLHVVFLEVLARQDCNEELVLEMLNAVANFIGNCRENKRLMFQSLVARAPQSTTLTQAILNLVRKKTTSLPLFRASFKIFKGLALDAEARNMMWKVVASICCMLDQLAKAKDHNKALLVLEFMTNFTCSVDGQVTLMQTEGAFNLLVSVARSQALTQKAAALRILCNLAVAKENKSRFILTEEFITALQELLTASDPDITALTAALIRALVHESEKSKVALKNEGILDLAS
ncbi:hypothetical protein HDU88_003579 [Geranomyces variabilis]|nr:hypothetical protein HDU88_003579 [Geranomyces variabilis]